MLDFSISRTERLHCKMQFLVLGLLLGAGGGGNEHRGLTNPRNRAEYFELNHKAKTCSLMQDWKEKCADDKDTKECKLLKENLFGVTSNISRQLTK